MEGWACQDGKSEMGMKYVEQGPETGPARGSASQGHKLPGQCPGEERGKGLSGPVPSSRKSIASCLNGPYFPASIPM